MSDDNLSAYLRELKRGTRILVGLRAVTMPTRIKGPMPDSPIVLPRGSARRLLRADRREARD